MLTIGWYAYAAPQARDGVAYSRGRRWRHLAGLPETHAHRLRRSSASIYLIKSPSLNGGFRLGCGCGINTGAHAGKVQTGRSAPDPKAAIASAAGLGNLLSGLRGVEAMDDRLKKVAKVKPKPEQPE